MMNGLTLRDAVVSGANNIGKYKQQVDELNVFPVPDGDTGTNMSMTIQAAARELSLMDPSASVSAVAATAASALLRGARGNSGVILSLLFRGIAKGLNGLTEADGADLARALSMGVEAAYKAVMKPTEGTILTVARLAAEEAVRFAGTNRDAVETWDLICKSAAGALAKTPEMLPVLKKAGVVDAGGKGLLCIFEGMLSVMKDGVMVEPADAVSATATVIYQDDEDEEINFTYCTEFIVNRDPEITTDPRALRAYLETIGDCVVVVDDPDIIKIHVHTDNPGNALQEGLKFGSLVNMKIENMREQHKAKVAKAKNSANQPDTYVPVDNSVEYGFVAVAAGEGVQGLFSDLGVNSIVSGGQTMNPSTEDILKAVHATPAKTVFILPNNKNIIMAAEQATVLADRKAYVLQTKSIPQGLSAMLAFDSSEETEANLLAMTKAFEKVQTGQITFAARDSDYEGHSIKEGELLALENGRLSFTERDLQKAVARLTRSLVKRDSSYITVIYGKDVSEADAEAAVEAVKAKLPESVELTLVNGGQPVYYFIISVE